MCPVQLTLSMKNFKKFSTESYDPIMILVRFFEFFFKVCEDFLSGQIFSDGVRDSTSGVTSTLLLMCV